MRDIMLRIGLAVSLLFALALPAQTPAPAPPSAPAASAPAPAAAPEGEKAEVKACPAPPAEGQAPAYRELEVKDGGHLKGRVKFEGSYQPKKWKVVKDQKVCGDAVADESLVADASGGLRFVAVTIEDIKAGKALPKAVKEVANKACLYQPHVETFSVCDKVMITNQDDVLHNTHAYLGAAVFEPVKPAEKDGLLVISEEDVARSQTTAATVTTLFNLGLPTKDFKPKKTLREPGIVTLKCDAGHTWMTGFIIVKPHPYHAVTAADGTYAITDVPPGDYTVSFWHERLGEQKLKVTIKAGETATLDATFAMK